MTIPQSISKIVPVLALAGVTVGLCVAFPNAATDPETGMVMRLPDRIPGCAAYEPPVSDEEKKWLPGDTGILKRMYYPEFATTSDEARQRSILATLILSGTDRRSLHRPEVCLDGQGWEIWDRKVETLQIGEETLEVMDFYLRKKVHQEDGTLKPVRAHYIYWWVGKSTSTPLDFERILITVMDNMFRNINNRWGYPSVMVNVDLESGESAEEEARKKAFDFIRDYGPMFQKSLGATE